MKKIIIKIEQLATLLFADQTYIQFINYIETNQINAARLLVDTEIELNDSIEDKNLQFEHSIGNKLQDLLMDLIINEIDEGRESKQIKSSTG